MQTFAKHCDELYNNGGILKDSRGTCYYKPGYTLHREDSPAIELNDGAKYWYYNGKSIMDHTQDDVTPEQVLDFKLRIL